MTSNRPYLLRAMYEWLVDNDQTPHLLIDTSERRMSIPRQFVNNDRIVLNIGPNAVRSLVMGNDIISFAARFGGVLTEVSVPPPAILSIYAKETGLGMVFSTETSDIPDTPEALEVHHNTNVAAKPAAKPSSGRPKLKIVK
ncbi:hypothetical protein TI05_06010 [Achromatium sp. WMS3]|nr:hypothetical protein TI05_06010 [Achromatium sp. WMS3]